MSLSTPGSCCGHNLNMHTGEGRDRYLLPCLVCTCPAFTPEKDQMSVDSYVPRRCRAYHAQLGIQCEGEASEATTHIEDHWATVANGNIVRWDDLLAVSRESAERLANDPTTGAEVIREKLAANGIGNGSARLGQVGGEHYRKFKIQPWDVIDEYELSFYAGNALKYLLRAGNKGAVLEDLRKCRHYLDKLIEVEEGKE